MKELILNDGRKIPQVGFGTAAIGEFQQDDGYVKDVILQAIEAGYRHIDTASLYGNERSVGAAIEESGVPRKEFFLTTKVWDTQQGFDETMEAFKSSRDKLRTDYLDLYLIHWPYPEKTRPTWQAMEKLWHEKKIKSLGLSNFRKQDIQQLMAFAEIKPVYNQLELHPYLTQAHLVEYCESKGIVVSCWSPLGSGSWSGVKLEDKPVCEPYIEELADKYNVSVGQIILKWDVQQGRVVIPKSESEKNIKANLELDHFALKPEEINGINGLNRDSRFGDNPDNAYEANLKRQVPR